MNHKATLATLPNPDTQDDNSKANQQDDKILLRLATHLLNAVDQVLREQLVMLNRSEFIRRAIRFTLDNLDQFKNSEAASINERQNVESVARINSVRDLHQQLFTYKEQLQKEPQTPTTIKQLSFLIYIIGEMVFKMND